MSKCKPCSRPPLVVPRGRTRARPEPSPARSCPAPSCPVLQQCISCADTVTSTASWCRKDGRLEQGCGLGVHDFSYIVCSETSKRLPRVFIDCCCKVCRQPVSLTGVSCSVGNSNSSDNKKRQLFLEIMRQQASLLGWSVARARVVKVTVITKGYEFNSIPSSESK